MEKILVSSCLLGEPVRYDAKANPLDSETLKTWYQQGRVISFCPEMAGGLSVPREPAEIQSDERVVTLSGVDVSEAFMAGAHKALQVCRANHIRFALLKESSPSCGRNLIYDGSHTGRKVPGMGLTARLLEEHGIRVFSEQDWPALLEALAL